MSLAIDRVDDYILAVGFENYGHAGGSPHLEIFPLGPSLVFHGVHSVVWLGSVHQFSDDSEFRGFFEVVFLSFILGCRSYGCESQDGSNKEF